MTGRGDIVVYCTRRLVEMYPHTTVAQAWGVQRDLSRAWGGERVYPRAVIKSFMVRLYALYPDIPPDQALQVEADLCRVWGSHRVYVNKAAAQGKALRLADLVSSGWALKDAMREAGVNRRTGYRLLSRRWYVR